MNSRKLTLQESKNLGCLNRSGLASCLLFVTETGLRKSILDATESMRTLLVSSGLHDYSQQAQGQGSKRIITSYLHSQTGKILLKTSLYRPNTKNGDPRIWFSRFDSYSSPNDVCATFVFQNQLHVINLSKSTLAQEIESGRKSELSSFFFAKIEASGAIAAELLSRFRELAESGPLEAVCKGPTAIGRSVETALGIAINSSKKPDYKGIEIKTGRDPLGGRENRATLFACVPDWSISRCKSSRQILEKFGYPRNDDFKLYCTVSTKGKNSQGLVLNLDETERFLRERFVTQELEEVAIWKLSELEERLAKKHRETFWIKAKSIHVVGKEQFILNSITHTRNPNLPHLERMISDGTVTMDHLIKRTPTGGAHEKGPLFKIERPRIQELFNGEPVIYKLV